MKTPKLFQPHSSIAAVLNREALIARSQLRLVRAVTGLMVALLSLMAVSARAGNSTWVGLGNQTPGNAIWGGVANWVGNTPADGAGFTATFGNTFNNGFTCIVNTARSIGNITYTNPVNANNFTLAKHASDFTLTLNNNASSPVINVTQSDRTLTIEPRVGGTGGLTKTGPGTLRLSTNNSYSGKTIISAGILTLGHTLAMSNSVLDTANSIAGDAANGLKTTVTTLTLGGLSGNKDLASVFTSTSGGYDTVTVLTLNPGSGVSNSYSGTIADGATGMGLTMTGAGIQTLSGANTFTGPALVNSGTLALNGGSLAVPITVNNGGALDLPGTGTAPGLEFPATGSMGFDVANGGLLSITGVNGVTNRGGAGSITINITGAVPTNGTYTLMVYSGSLQGSGFSAYQLGATPGGASYTLINTPGAVQLTVGSALIWTGAQSSEWRTTAIGGLMNWTWLGSPSDYTNGSTVVFDDTVGVGSTTPDISVADVTPAGVSFENNTNNYTLQGSAAIAGASSLRKKGSGTLTILNNNTYTGLTAINGGVVQVGNGGTSGTLGTGNVTDSASLVFNRSDSTTVGNAISGTGSLTQAGTGTLTLSGANTYSGATTINAGTVNLPGAITGSSITVNGSAVFNETSMGVIAGSGVNFTHNSTGTSTLSGTNTHSGSGSVSDGTLVFDGGSWNSTAAASTRSLQIGNGLGRVCIITNGATLTVGGFGSVGWVNNSSATLIMESGALTFKGISGGTPADRGLVIGEYAGSTGLFTQNGGALTVSNTVWLGQIGTGTWDMNRGGATIGKLSLGSTVGTGLGTLNLFNGLITIGAGGITKGSGTATINLNGGALAASAAWSSVLPVSLGGTGPTVNTAGGNITLSGAVSGSGGLVKIGTNTLTLSGTNTYSGTTTIDAGKLLVNNTGGSGTGSGAVTVNRGGTLGGTGTVGGEVTVHAGGVLSPGTGTNAGRLSLNQFLWLQPDATVAIKLNGTNDGAYDQLVPGWDFLLEEPTLALTLGYTPATGDQYTIFDGGLLAIPGGNFAGLPEGASFAAGGYRFEIHYWGGDGNAVVLTCLGRVNTAPTIFSSGPLSGSSFPLTFGGPSGQSYQVLTSTNVALPMAGWTVLTTGTFGASPVTYTDTTATNAQRFYRITSP